MNIITHNGCFHTDEVTACMLLTLAPSITGQPKFTRTRDPKLIEQADVVVDVGQVYDPSQRRFDHHQFPLPDGRTETWGPTQTIPLSSAGMVWKHYGQEIIQRALSLSTYTVTHQDIQELHETLYHQFFLELDANDNGINQYTIDPTAPKSVKNYSINVTLVGTVSRMNTQDLYNDEAQLVAFHQAMDLAGMIFQIHLRSHIDRHFLLKEERTKMQAYFQNNLHEDGRIIVVNEDLKNWKQLLRELDTEERILFIVYPRDAPEWGVQTISKDGFIPRQSLAEETTLLAALTNPKDLVFAHKKLFIAVTRTQEAAIQCARASLPAKN